MLKVIVSGKATLYQYENSEYIRFFLQKDTGAPEPLIYKQYHEEANIRILENNAYKNQLLTSLSGAGITARDLELIGYYKADIAPLVKKYNTKMGDYHEDMAEKKKRTKIAITIRPGIMISDMKVSNNKTFPPVNTALGSNISFRFGMEAAFSMPFLNNKWAIIIEPAYQSYQGSWSNELYDNKYTIQVDYKSVECHLGARHLIYLANRTTLFFNGTFVLDIPVSGSLTQTNREPFNFNTSVGVAAGAGVGWNRLSLEARYNFTRSSMLQYPTEWDAKYNGIAVVAVFKLTK